MTSSGLRFSVALLVLAMGCHQVVRFPATSPDRPLPILPPPLRNQIIDHINAYLTEVNCWQSNLGKHGHFLAVGTRNGDPTSTYSFTPSSTTAAPCTSWNMVGEILYRAPDVDNAVYDALNEQMGKPLFLRSALMALWEFVIAGPAQAPEKRSMLEDPVACERRIHELFWRVPFLSETLVKLVAARLACQDCGPIVGQQSASPVLSITQIRRVVVRMSEGANRPDGSTVYGIRALQPEFADLDPNVVVALSRAAYGSLVSAPTVEDTVSALHEMGLRVSEGETAP